MKTLLLLLDDSDKHWKQHLSSENYFFFCSGLYEPSGELNGNIQNVTIHTSDKLQGAKKEQINLACKIILFYSNIIIWLEKKY